MLNFSSGKCDLYESILSSQSPFKALKMGIKKQHRLDKIYDASNWVTFINPKVDLNY